MTSGLFGDDFVIKAPALDATKNPALRGVTLGKDLGDKKAGVVGVNYATQSLGLLGGKDKIFSQNVGVYGESNQQGVFGHSTDSAGTGVYGNSVGSGFGVRGDSTDGIAVQGQSFGSGLAGKFIGDVEITGQLNGHSLSQLLEKIGELEDAVNKLRERLQWSQPRVIQSNVPVINVFYRGVSGGNHLFDLRANSLEKNRTVTVRVKDNDGFRYEISSFNSGANGSFGDLSNPCSFQVPYGGSHDRLFIAITDGRPDLNDLTGLLWSNTVRG
jgi:hypothetical protein